MVLLEATETPMVYVGFKSWALSLFPFEKAPEFKHLIWLLSGLKKKKKEEEEEDLEGNQTLEIKSSPLDGFYFFLSDLQDKNLSSDRLIY